MDFCHDNHGLLHVEGVPLPKIAEAVGTPVHIYSAGEIPPQRRTGAEPSG